jgi:pyruvate,water dikinase
LETYLGDFGDRCVEELKLESKTMRDDPRFLMEMIKNYLRSGEKSVSNSSKQRVSPGTEAERTVDRRLGWKLSKAVIPKRWLYRWVLKNARRAVRNRENQRMERTRAFGLVRRIFRSIGVSFCRLGLIEHSDDVFYLEVEEIERFIEGASSYTDLATAVANRKAQYDRYRALPNLPEHFVTYGAVNVGNPFVEEDPPHSEGTILSGLGAFPGTLEGLAVVMVTPDPSVALDGKVLVTYQTDPGWVVLFPFIGGLVVERGSMLSHSAIVAREMGIPAVVGVRGAVSRIQTGDRLRLDAGRGTVEIIQ